MELNPCNVYCSYQVQKPSLKIRHHSNALNLDTVIEFPNGILNENRISHSFLKRGQDLFTLHNDRTDKHS